MTIEQLFNYYGADYVAMAMTFVSIYLIGSKKKSGFIVGSIGNCLWIAIAILSNTVGLVLVNVGITILNVRAYINWSKEDYRKKR